MTARSCKHPLTRPIIRMSIERMKEKGISPAVPWHASATAYHQFEYRANGPLSKIINKNTTEADLSSLKSCRVLFVEGGQAGPMSESETTEACVPKDREEFRLIVDTYKAPLMALAMNVLRNRQDAEDACQETFIQAYRHLDSFSRGMSIKSWLFTILFRRCLDVLRKKRRFRAFSLQTALEPQPSNRDSATTAPKGREISNALLDKLTAKERLAVVLWANEDLNSSEIANILGCAASTARVHLVNGRRKIKVLLEK